MFEKIYYWFHRLVSAPQERGEYSSGPWSKKIRAEALRLCQDREQGRLLEVGCGEGMFLHALRSHVPYLEIFGVDRNCERLLKAQKRVSTLQAPAIKLSLQDGMRLSFRDECFDIVVCIGVLFNLHCFEDVKMVVAEMKRVCKKSGFLVFEFRNAWNPVLYFKYRFARYYDRTLKQQGVSLKTYSPEKVENLLRELNLEVERVVNVGFFLRYFAPVILMKAKRSR